MEYQFLWHNGIMNVIVEIDKAGRIVVPKKLREILHLTPGTRLKVERTGDHLTFTPSAREARVVIKDGVPFILPAESESVPLVTNEMVSAILEEGHRKRKQQIIDSNEETE